MTGSSRGIGLAVAEAFSREGAKVIITSEEGQKEDLQKVKAASVTQSFLSQCVVSLISSSAAAYF